MSAAGELRAEDALALPARAARARVAEAVARARQVVWKTSAAKPKQEAWRVPAMRAVARERPALLAPLAPRVLRVQVGKLRADV